MLGKALGVVADQMLSVGRQTQEWDQPIQCDPMSLSRHDDDSYLGGDSSLNPSRFVNSLSLSYPPPQVIFKYFYFYRIRQAPAMIAPPDA